MGDKLKTIITNFSYTVTSNLFSMIISTMIIMVIPKLIGVNEYGYWQLYLFFTSYLGFFNIGWVEGIYLRYGGEEYNNLNRGLFTAQFWSFFIYIIITGILIIIYSTFCVVDINKQFIFQTFSFCLITSVPRGFLLFLLQSTNRIKEFSKIMLFDRIIYCLIILILLLFGVRDYQLLILSDLAGKTVTLIWSIYVCKEIVFSKTIVSLRDNLKEMLVNISVGIKLLFANIGSMLILGVVRLGIELYWSVNIFGKVSLVLSISNLMMLFIDAIGIIMFPILRRTDSSKLQVLYIKMRDFLMVLLLGSLVIYYPVNVSLTAWLPKYHESLIYMGLVFPICIYEGKMALLVNTYLKTLRKEKLMLKINLLSVLLSLFITLVTTTLLGNLTLVVASIVSILAFRCLIAELFISAFLGISLYRDIILEIMMTIIFILTSWFMSTWYSIFLYLLAYLTYLIIKRKDLGTIISNIRVLMKSTAT